MPVVRVPAVAGAFYPNDKSQLRAMIQGYLDRVQIQKAPPKAIIAPHAGYIYSGPIAASVFAQLRQMRHDIQRVVLLGPSHRVPFTGLALTTADAYTTPLGTVPIDKEACLLLKDLPQVITYDDAHIPEHSLEVEVPFLQEVLDQWSLVPLVVGQSSPEAISEVLERLWGGPETLVVISSDLSHYLDYETAQTIDQATSQAIESLHWQAISPEGACGRLPISGLLHRAYHTGLKPQTIDLRNSGDTAGTKDRVVGYGAYVFH